MPETRATRVVNLRFGAYDVYGGRGRNGMPARKPGEHGWLGNPYSVRDHGRQALEMFRGYFLARVESDAEFRATVLALRGKTLGCFCKPGACHLDIVAEWIDAQPAAEPAPQRKEP